MDMAKDTLAEVPDDTLMVLYANGDPDAARLLMQRLAPRVLGYASRLLSDRAEAEDVTQEAMLRLWRIAPQWQPGQAQVTTWLYRVATNLCIDRRRNRSRRPSVTMEDAPELADPGPTALAGVIEAERMRALQAALDTLPERQRQAVVLRHIEGLANPEIAEVLDCGVEAVESLTARGKKALMVALAGQRAELGYQEEGDT